MRTSTLFIPPVTPPADVYPSVIGIRVVAFTWTSDNDGTLPLEKNLRNFALRITNEVTFKRGSMKLIVGPTGSGKTSMLMVLGEKGLTLRYVSGVIGRNYSDSPLWTWSGGPQVRNHLDCFREDEC